MPDSNFHSGYALRNVTISVNGSPVMGLADGDDAFSVEPSADVGSGIIGAQGDGIFSQSSDRSAMIRIKLLQNSPTHKLLHQILKRQERSVGSFPVAYRDKSNREGGSGPAYISQKPTEGKGQNATTREWTLWCPDWRGDVPQPRT